MGVDYMYIPRKKIHGGVHLRLAYFMHVLHTVYTKVGFLLDYKGQRDPTVKK